jgi:hypothetical protein
MSSTETFSEGKNSAVKGNTADMMWPQYGYVFMKIIIALYLLPYAVSTLLKQGANYSLAVNATL